ncbi:MAG TPA: zinc-binding dehydrogenase [Saprospiraceae bacterium]|nr:zinc-binding dehydrogenase [Saprospiraceae bacterium]
MKSLILKESGLHIENKPFIPNSATKIMEFSNASINHRDLWIVKGQYAGIKFPVILGSDGAGKCDGEEVILNPSVNWISDPNTQPKNYEIIGLPNDGTFTEVGCFNPVLINPKPGHLSMAEAAALPLAGLTAYRLLFSRCKLTQYDKVLIVGIGGGVALLAAQFALAIGCEVWVISGEDEKIEKAKAMGVKDGVNYKSDNWHKDLLLKSGGFDVIIDSAGGRQFTQLASVANAGARIGIYGGTLGKIPELSPQIIFWKQISILGSTMGNHQEFKEMLSFVNTYKIKPVIDSIYSLEDFKSAFERMDQGKQFGKIVFEII